MMRLDRTGEGDRGAVAVLTAILAVVLLVVAALAVEVTNQYATDRASQRTVDLAATSAAQFLPSTCDAVNEAFATLDDNPIPYTEDESGLALDDFVDGVAENGEIQVLTELEDAPPPYGPNDTAAPGGGAWVDAGDCTQTERPGLAEADAARGRPRLVRVMAPVSEVPFVLGRAAGAEPVGNDEVPDQLLAFRMATAGIVGSGQGLGYGLMPVAIPAGCITELGYGPRTVVTAPKSFPDEVDFTPDGFNQGPRLVDSDDVPISYNVESTDVATGTVVVDFFMRNLSTDPRLPAGAVSFDFHTNPSAAATTTRRVPTLTSPVTGVPGTLVGSPAPGTGGTWRATIRVNLPTPMATTLGTWLVRAAQLSATTPSNRRWTNDQYAGEVFVNGDFYVGGGCDEPSQGNFGLIRADRDDAEGVQFDANVADGLDHTLTAFPANALPDPAGGTTVCLSDGDPEGALLDITPGGPVGGANCIAIETGNMAGPVTRGLVTGTTGSTSYPGRLDFGTGYSKPETAPDTCDNPATGPGSGQFLWQTPSTGRVQILNTVLSCYLAPEFELADVVAGTEGSLVEAIYGDPRFFFVPVLNGDERPPNASNHYAIKEFVGGFITSQQVDGTVTCGTGRRGGTCNGIEFGSRQVMSMTTFIFPVSALPAQTQEPVDEGDDGFEDFIAGTKEVVLFE